MYPFLHRVQHRPLALSLDKGRHLGIRHSHLRVFYPTLFQPELLHRSELTDQLREVVQAHAVGSHPLFLCTKYNELTFTVLAVLVSGRPFKSSRDTCLMPVPYI